MRYFNFAGQACADTGFESGRRPVLATVMSLIIVLLGLIAYQRLAVSEYPDIESRSFLCVPCTPVPAPGSLRHKSLFLWKIAYQGLQGLKRSPHQVAQKQ